LRLVGSGRPSVYGAPGDILEPSYDDVGIGGAECWRRIAGYRRRRVVGAGPRLGDDAGNLLWDLVVHDAGAGVPESIAPCNAAPTPRSLSVVGLGVSGLYLLGSLGSLPMPINWRWVGDMAESTCSQVTTVVRLLHETLASVHQNILHLIRVSQKREKKILLTFLWLPPRFFIHPMFCFRISCLRAAWTCLRC
jgi:hypothetical protein